MLRAIRRGLISLLGDDMRKSRLKTLTELVSGAIRGKTLTEAGIGRHIPGQVNPKHQTKKVYRFYANEKVEFEDISHALMRALVVSGTGTLCLAVDCTEIGCYLIITGNVVTRSRAIPVYWKVVVRGDMLQRDFEEAFLVKLRALVPEDITPILLEDRGFDSVSSLRFIEKLDFKFVVRAGSNVGVRYGERSDFVAGGKLPHKRGPARDFGMVDFCASDPIRVRLVFKHDWMQDEPWILVTNLSAHKNTIVQLYSRRFEIEECYRDLKDLRDGFKLRDFELSDPARVERLLLVAAVAYLLMFLAGKYGEEHQLDRRYKSNTRRRREFALWRLGRWVLKRHFKRLGLTFEDIAVFLASAAIPWSKEELGLAC